MNAFMGRAVVCKCVLCNMCALNSVKDEAGHGCIGTTSSMVAGQSVGSSTGTARSDDLEKDWMCAMFNYCAAGAVALGRWHIAAVAHIAGCNWMKPRILNVDRGSRRSIVNACAAVVAGEMDGRVTAVKIRKMGAPHGNIITFVIVVAVDVSGSAMDIANGSSWMGCQCNIVISDTAVVDNAVGRSTRMGNNGNVAAMRSMGDNWNVVAMRSSRCSVVMGRCGRGGIGIGAVDTTNGRNEHVCIGTVVVAMTNIVRNNIAVMCIAAVVCRNAVIQLVKNCSVASTPGRIN
mmetsp:Transcript_4587/g.13227  ORF Transcript_4587/g.13227 Transcript_4587/m.13227 type:complete len:290 (-) Transcript_4587:48-917(-)